MDDAPVPLSMTGPPLTEATALSEEAPAAPAERGLSVSVEALVWAALLTAASALRLGSLERLPFTLDEAGRAVDALRVSQGTVPDTWSGDLVAAATSYLYRVFGEGELLARLLPAAAGAALVAVLWFARPWLGRTGALVAAFLVALSPLSVMFARSAMAFSAGGLLGAVMVASLFAYLHRPRAWLVFPFAVALGLAPLTDAMAVTAAIAVLGFLALEGGLLGDREITRAWGAFRRSPLQWLTVVLVLAAALELGLTHFGTSFQRSGLPGLRQWTDMFDLPRDSRPPEYHAALLLAYEWPALLAGGLGFVFFVYRLLRAPTGRGPSLCQRFLLVWTALAALILALATRREAGQLLILLLPLALLAGAFVEEAAAHIDWSVLRRWWPVAAAALGLIAYAALLLTEWSSETGVGDWARYSVLLALGGTAALIASAYVFLRRDAGAIAVTVLTALALPFLSHGALAVAFSDGAEFATDLRILDRAEQFRDTVELLAAERGGTIVVEEGLAGALAWPLRDSPVVFGGDTKGASVVVAPADQTPAGFIPLGDAWRVAQGWYPQELLHPLAFWRWLAFREPYGSLDTVDVRIYVPTL